MARVYKGVAGSEGPRSERGKEIRKENRKRIQEEASEQQVAMEQNFLKMETFTNEDGSIDEIRMEMTLKELSETDNVNWENADDNFLENAERVLDALMTDSDNNEKLQDTWMKIQGVIAGREQAQAQVNNARESAEALAQAQAESPEAGELARMEQDLQNKKDEMGDLAGALGWKKMFNKQYRSLSQEVKTLSQAVDMKRREVQQLEQAA